MKFFLKKFLVFFLLLLTKADFAPSSHWYR